MFPVAAKCAEGFVYLGENVHDMTEELIYGGDMMSEKNTYSWLTQLLKI